jgi:hypothetical protein
MTYDTTDDPRERVLDQMEYLASLEAKTGDGRALRTVQRLRAMLDKLPEVSDASQQD